MTDVPHYDFILTGDFRYPGGTSSAIAEEIKVLKDSSWSWKLDQFNSRVFIKRRINDKIAGLAGPDDYLHPGSKATCGTWFIHNPHCLLWGVPRTQVKAGRIVVVAHQAPVSFAGRFYYDPWAIDDILRRSHPDAEVIWAPISPLCRKMFREIGFDRSLLSFDWFNIFSGPFSEPSPLQLDLPIRVGCHGRSQPDKWPATREVALQVYPDHPDFQVTLLGPDPLMSGPVAPFPERWTTYRFGAIPVDDFLQRIDFFVYRPRPELVEAFGRTIAEAVLNGKLAILPPSLSETFGDLAVYAEPQEVQDVVRRYWEAPDDYLAFVRESSRKSASLYGPEGLEERLARIASGGDLSHRLTSQSALSVRVRARWDSVFTALKHSLKIMVKRSLMAATRGRMEY